MIFTKEDREKVVDYLSTEIPKAEEEMIGRIAKWNRWRRQREALPEFERKVFPGSQRPSSNVVPPISMSNTNTVFADTHNSFNLHPFWTMEAVRKDEADDVAIAKFMCKYFDVLAESRNDLDRKRTSKVVHYEESSLGFCVVKVPWTKRQWTITELDPDGNPVDTDVVLHHGPEIVPIPAEDFLRREAYQDIQTAPWIAHRLHHTWPEIQQLGEQGYYQNVDELEKWARTGPTESEALQQAREGATQSLSDIWDLYECYFFWEVDGYWRDCIATVELGSGVVLREMYNELGYRPFEKFGHLIRPHRFEWIGVGHITEGMQEEGTMLHNARNDSIHASVFGMFVARRGAGARQDEPIYPAKIWLLDDPSRDISVLKLPEPGQSSLVAEQMTLAYAQRGTGKGDATGGFADNVVKTRDSPGLQRGRMQASAGVFGAITEGVEDSWSTVGYLIYLQLIHHREEVLANEADIGRLSGDEMKLLEKALSIPKEKVPLRLRFSVRTSDIEQTFEMQRQNLLTRVQLEAMFFQQTFPVVQMLFGAQGQQMLGQAPELWRYLARMYTARCRMMEEAIKFFGEDDTGKYVPDYKKLEGLLDMQRMLNAQAGMMGGIPGVAGQQQGGGAVPAPEAAFPVAAAAGSPAAGGGGGAAPAAVGGGSSGGAAGEPGVGAF